MMDKETTIKEQVNAFEKSQSERQDKYYVFIKTIITLAIGLLGVIVSLKSDIQTSEIKHLFFTTTTILLALGILSGVIILYSEVHILNDIQELRAKYIRQLIANEKVKYVTFVARKKYYILFEYLFFFSFSLSLISLVIYSSIQC